MKKVEIKKGQENWLDFSTLAMFMTCPMKYFWRIKRGIEQENNMSLEFGKAIHEGLASWNMDKDDEKAIQSFKNALIHVNHIEDPKRNINSGIEVLSRYFNRWRDEIYTTIQTEIGFAFEMTSPVGEFIYLGKIDRYVDSPMGKAIVESKTTTIGGDKWLLRGKPNMQIEGYLAGIETITGELPQMAILDIIHVHEKSQNIKPAQRIITTRTKKDIEHWAENIAMWWMTIYNCEKYNFWNRNTEACVPVIGYSCPYQSLCSEYNSSKDVPEKIENSNYIYKEWYPFESLLQEKK